jgi:hypothetical protein
LREKYRGRELRLVDGCRVVVFNGDKEVYSTSSNFTSEEEAMRAARALVDTELEGHILTPPTNDPAA